MLPRMRRTTSSNRDNPPDPVLQRSTSAVVRKLERARSSNLNNAKCGRRLRRYWKWLVFGSGCVAVVWLSAPKGGEVEKEDKKAFTFRPKWPTDVCQDIDIPWAAMPASIDLHIHVVARGNTNSLRTTLMSLHEACYPEDANLPLSVWALTMHAQEVLAAQDGFVWTHGTYQVRTLTTDHEDVPPLEGWARMWTQPTSREVRLVIPEGLELSQLFYMWLSSTFWRYLGDEVTEEEKHIFRENVFGISLSATGLSEVSGKPLSWQAYKATDGEQPIFHTLPGSRGTAFFGWQWGDFATFMDARARVLDADSSEGVPLLDIPGRATVPSWAGSLERFLAEFVHGRGLGILHPNLDGRVSFARRLSPSIGAVVEVVASGDSGEASGVEQLEVTNSPTLRGADDGRRGQETLVRTTKDVTKALKQPSVSTLAAYDLIFRRHPDVTHLRLLSYRFMQRLRASANRNESLEQLWRRPIAPRPIYSEAKYLIYQPQFGMGNQLRALEAGLAVARVLKRILVVPDYISDNGEGIGVRYDAIWEYGFLEELVGRDNVILQADFNQLLTSDQGGVDPPTKVFVADMPIKQLTGIDEYFKRLGWGTLPQINLPVANTTEAGWSEIVGLEDQVLAVSAMFGMFQGWSEDSHAGGEHWHRMVRLHVSEESTWLHDFVEDILTRFKSKAADASVNKGRGEAAGSKHGTSKHNEARGGGETEPETEFMCAHIRRQDFEASCARYDEEFQSGKGREWVVEALQGGGVCWVEESDFRHTVDVFVKRAPSQLGVTPRFVFATSDDSEFLAATKLGNAVPVFSLDDVTLPAELADKSGVQEADVLESLATGRTLTAEEVRAALPAIDVAVCSRAPLLVLNYFSTYSALIKSKAKAQPDYGKALYWKVTPDLSNWWTTYFGWLSKLFHRSS